jgi:ATP-dependent DNA helicase PIF1
VSLIHKAKLIIWDEASMMHKHYFEAVDRTLKDILKSVDKKNKNILFGGKVVIFGRDFRQILSVIPKGTRPKVVHATINYSVLWNFCEVLKLSKNMRLHSGASSTDIEERRLFSEWVSGIGDGEIEDISDIDLELDIPSDLLIPNSGDPLASIVESTYPQLLQNMNDITYFQNRAILAPKNSIVITINDNLLDLISSEEKTYLSYDTPNARNVDGDAVDDVHTPEFLNTVSASGLPNHKLRLKVGVPVMLLRNLDKNLGLCNRTRLIITIMRKYVLVGKIISGSNIGDKVFIPRLSLTPSDVRIPLQFQRRQFSLMVSFAMTIHKSQGQSPKHVWIYFRRRCFYMVNCMLRFQELLLEKD